MSKINNEESLCSGWVEELHEEDVEVVELQGEGYRRRSVPRRGLHLIPGEFVQIFHCYNDAGHEVLSIVPEDTDWNPHRAAIA